MKRVTLVVGFCAATVLLSQRSRAEEEARPRTTVFIAPFEVTDPSAPCSIELLLVERLRRYGIKVQRLDSVPADSAELFASHKKLDFLVTGTVIQNGGVTATARIIDRGGGELFPPEFSGGSACKNLATAIVQHLSSRHTVAGLVASRRAEAERKLATYPRDHESLLVCGLAARYDGEWSPALEWFRKAEEVSPDDVRIQLNLALCYKNLGDEDGWWEHLERAEGIDPGHEGVIIAVGNYFSTIGLYDQAVARYEKLLQSPRNSALVRWNLGVLYSRAGNIQKAYSYLNEIPKDSIFFDDARPWALRLEEQILQREIATAPKTSTLSHLNLPGEFGYMVLVVAFALLLSPYLAGQDLGVVKIPKLASGMRRSLKYAGPVIMLLSIALYVPMWHKPTAADRDDFVPVFESVETTGFGEYFRAPEAGARSGR